MSTIIETVKKPFTKSRPLALSAQLADKRVELEVRAEEKADEAVTLGQLAAEAKQDSYTAAGHAEAVGRALDILEAAGVSL